MDNWQNHGVYGDMKLPLETSNSLEAVQAVCPLGCSLTVDANICMCTGMTFPMLQCQFCRVGVIGFGLSTFNCSKAWVSFTETLFYVQGVEVQVWGVQHVWCVGVLC